ncbi:NAD-binding protein, partial [Klenkia sp. LSe6-5]
MTTTAWWSAPAWPPTARALGRGRHVAVVGGGYVGTELAAALVQNGTRVMFVFPGTGEPARGVVHHLEADRLRGVLLWNVWDSTDRARELLAAERGGPPRTWWAPSRPTDSEDGGEHRSGSFLTHRLTDFGSSTGSVGSTCCGARAPTA